MAALSLSFLFPSPGFLAKVSSNNRDWHQKKKDKKKKTALLSQIGLKWRDRACHLGAIGYSLQCGSTEDSGQAPQPCCVGAVLSHRAKTCFLASSPSLSMRRKDVRGLGSGYSYHRAVAEIDCTQQQPTTGLVSCQQRPRRVDAGQASCTRCSKAGRAFLRHIVQPGTSSERMGWSMHSSGNWTQPNPAPLWH